MTLPRGARRLTIVVMRSAPVEPVERDDWRRRVRTTDTVTPADPPEHLRTIGDLQPRKISRITGEVATSTGLGAALGEFVIFTDVLDIRTGDTIRTEPIGIGSDDGLRYNVTRVDRPGQGRRLDHLEVGADLVTAPVPV